MEQKLSTELKNTVQPCLLYKTAGTLLSVSSLTFSSIIVGTEFQELTMASSQHSGRPLSTVSSTSRSSNEADMIDSVAPGSSAGSQPIFFAHYRSFSPSASGPSSPAASHSSGRASAGSIAAATTPPSMALSSSPSNSSNIAISIARSRSEASTIASPTNSAYRRSYTTRTITPPSSHSRQSDDYTRWVGQERRPVIPTPPTRPQRSPSSVQFHEPSFTTGISGRMYRTTQVSPVRSATSSSSIRLWPVLAPRRRG